MTKVERTYRGSGQAERTEARRVALVAAGQKLIGTQGYASVSVRAVCVEAGLTERYFYESFANKEALLGAVYLDAVGALNARLQPAVDADGSIEQRTRLALNAYFGFMKDNPEAARIVLMEVLGVSAEIDQLYREVIAQFAGMLRKQLGLKDLGTRPGAHPKGERGGEAPLRRKAERPDETVLMSGGLVGAAVQIATSWVLGGFATPQRAVVDSCARIFLAVANA